MTLPEIIYDIKRTISGGDTTVDSKFIDAHLTQVVNQARAEALSVHYMQMREKRSLSEANQDFIVLQNSSAFRQNITDGTTDADDLESDTGGADMPGGSAGSVLYRKLKKYSIEASEGTVYEWDKTTENRATTKVTDVCRFTLPSPVLKFGRNSGFLSFTDHSYDAIKGTQDDANYYYPAPQLGGDHVRVVHGLKELRDLQKHKASFPYKSGHRDLLTGDTGISQYRPTMSPSLYADTAPATAGSGNYTQWITLKNPIACITNSDLFLNGIPISHENSSESNYNNAVEDEGWSNNEYFELESQYNHQYRRKDVVMLIDTPIGKINPDNVKLINLLEYILFRGYLQTQQNYLTIISKGLSTLFPKNYCHN